MAKSDNINADSKKRNPDGESTTVDSSSSKSITETVDGSHRYVIKGYSLAKGMGIGKYLSSDVFTIGGYDWAIYFYPDGKNPEDNSGYVSVFIALASEGTDVRALFELSMMDQTENGNHKVHSHFERKLDSGPYTLKYRGSMWGYKRFFKRATLEASDFLKDDSLIINCKVGVVRTRKEGPKQYNVPMPPSDMGQNFKGVLESGIGSDITFEVGDERFRAHKLILAARSPVFKAQFFGNWALSPSMDKIVVEDIEPAVFKAMLQFMYGDELAELHEIVPESILVQHLLAAADRYGLDRLKLLCEAKLCQEVTTETVATTLALAEQHHCSQLKSVCLKFAAGPGNLGEMMKSEGFKHLEQSCPSMLSELLQAIAVIEENDLSGSQQQQASKKRSSSSNIGLNIYNQLAVDPNAAAAAGRRLRRRL